MRVLVTGAKGLLGTELVRFLRDAGDEVVAWDLPQNDVTEVDRTINGIHQLKPDAVFHLAAWTDVDGCEQDRARAAAVNFQGAWAVALGAAETGGKLLHISTDYVFDGRATRPYRENDKTGPLSVYGSTKLMGEQAVARAGRRRFIVRTSWLYGRTGRSFVNTVREKASRERELKVVDDQTGSPTWARDLAEPLRRIAASEKYGIYHVTNSGQCTWFELAREVVRLTGAACEVRAMTSAELGLPAPRPAFSVLENRNYRKLTGRTLRPWQDALREYLGEVPAT